MDAINRPEYDKYYFEIHKPIIEKNCEGIKWLIERGVEKKFGKKVSDFSIQLNTSRHTGLTGFLLFFNDGDGKTVFACDAEVVLNSHDQDWKVMESKITIQDIDNSIKTVRITSNPRSVSNEFEVSQVFVAAFLLTSGEEFNDTLKSISSEIMESLVNLKELE